MLVASHRIRRSIPPRISRSLALGAPCGVFADRISVRASVEFVMFTRGELYGAGGPQTIEERPAERRSTVEVRVARTTVQRARRCRRVSATFETAAMGPVAGPTPRRRAQPST